MLKSFWPYYGGKGKLAKLYPTPRFDTIVEPFAGAAGYATRHHHRNVVLFDKNATICTVWDFLIKASADDILKLPVDIDDLRNFPELPEGAKALIGFWFGVGGSQAPRKKPSPWSKELKSWGVKRRETIARQVELIKHWRVFHRDYWRSAEVVTEPATWYIDPPYQHSGTVYPESAKKIDFDNLGYWCKSLEGQVIVCEQEGADWLPFQHLCRFRRTPGTSGPASATEVIWLSDGNYRKVPRGFGFVPDMIHADDIVKTRRDRRK